jgi:hypothetical protein
MSQRLYIVLISSLLIFSIFYSLNRSLKAKSFVASADASDSRSVYIVSPFEWNQLNQDDKLWPKTFEAMFSLLFFDCLVVFSFVGICLLFVLIELCKHARNFLSKRCLFFYVF